MDVIVYAAACPRGEEHEAAYRLLGFALERELGVAPLPALARAPGGKPYFPDRGEIYFNLSHSHGGIVCALHDRPIGIDIEKRRPAPKRLAAGRTEGEFFRLWTAREASVKRDGLGIGGLIKFSPPDSNCIYLEGFLDGWHVTVCPSEAGCAVRTVIIEAALLSP